MTNIKTYIYPDIQVITTPETIQISSYVYVEDFREDGKIDVYKLKCYSSTNLFEKYDLTTVVNKAIRDFRKQAIIASKFSRINPALMNLDGTPVFEFVETLDSKHDLITKYYA